MSKQLIKPIKAAKYSQKLRQRSVNESPATWDFSLNSLVSKYLPSVRLDPLAQEAIPRIAKDPEALKSIQKAIKEIPTQHRLWLGDARWMHNIPDESVHLIVTSPPYFDLKRYPEAEGQLGEFHEYERFLTALEQVWSESYRLLVKGGRLIVVVGDVCRSRREFGAHM